MADPYLLDRFVRAQDQENTFATAREELRAGKKVTHWMWFVFPQIAGLGRSANAQRYAISSLGEAKAYLAHPVLGPRIIGCAAILASSTAASAEEIFGEIDAMKLRSSMTLFARADPDVKLFATVLTKFFGGESDPLSDRLIA